MSMGKKFHDKMREKPQGATIVGLAIRDLNEPDDTKLKSALVKFFKHHSEVTPLQVYLQTNAMTNQKTLIVLCRVMLKVTLTKCIANTNLLIDSIGFCKKTLVVQKVRRGVLGGQTYA